MASVNKVQIIGRLGRDPEIRHSPDGTAVANMSVATTSKWKDKNSGEWREDVEWHRVVMYGRTAEVAAEYLHKGSPVYTEGRLKTRKWEDKQGIERYTTEIIADNMQMLGGRDEQSQGDSTQSAPKQQYGQPQQNTYAQAKGGAPQQSMGNIDSDIPF